MAVLRPTPRTLCLLLLSALGASPIACAGKTGDDDGGRPCTDGSCPAPEPQSFRGCTDPTPLMEGVDTGIFKCSEGYVHRKEARTCPSKLPGDGAIEFPPSDAEYTISVDECSRDADCPENAYCIVRQTNAPGICWYMGPGTPPPPTPDYARVCIQGCREDADCGENSVCVCGDRIGHCVGVSAVAGCTEDADCERGARCLQNARTSNFGAFTFACQREIDACAADRDCSAGTLGAYCGLGETQRECRLPAVCGRPFLVDGEARVAHAKVTADWLGSPDVAAARARLPNDESLRQALAEHWSGIGLLEHASIAAFARFTLQLLALGAPAELVEASTRAQADEARHTRIAFALASRYAGRHVGAGPLSLRGALDDSSFEAVLRTTVLEGCLGETLAALEAGFAAEPCEDPVVRGALETIAADEARHAELAWRVVHWMLASRPDLAHVVRQELADFAEAERTASDATMGAGRGASLAARYGLLDAQRLRDCHEVARREVIAPCARALLGTRPAA